MSKFQENIKHLIPRPKTPVVKPPMYRSIYTEAVRRTYKSNNNLHKTMGYAEVELDPPSQFLKKHTRKEIRPFVGNVKNKLQLLVLYYYHLSGLCCKLNVFVCLFYIS